MTRVFTAEGIVKSFGDLLVLDGVDLAVRHAEIVSLLGPSGCGKTTLLRILLGLESHDHGTLSGSLRRSGYLPQDALLLPWKTVCENAALPLQIQRVPRLTRRRRVLDALPRFGLHGFGDLYPHQISGGMKQRAALLRAVLTGAEVLVLDEPFGALDLSTRTALQRWLSDLVRDLGSTLLFVTHDLDEAVVLSDRVVVLSARPAAVLGEVVVDLDEDARARRMSTAFLAARDRLLALVDRGSDDGA